MVENVQVPPPIAPEAPPVLTKSEKRKKIILLVVALITINLFVFGSLYYSVFKSNEAKKMAVGVNMASEKVNVSPIPSGPDLRFGEPSGSEKALEGRRPFPFQEMTIPYLRSREYNSSLGERTLVSQNGSYSSYLTSYDSDGFKVNGQLTIPAGDVPENGWPGVIFVHGYIPPANYQTLANYSSYVDYLASQGFVVFKIDLRGHAQSEGEPGGGYYSSDYIVDTLNARAALQSTDFVNPNGIGLWGHSMAGNVVSRALAASPEIPAIVIWGGAVYTYEDFQQFSIEDNSYQPPSEDSPSRRSRNEMFELYGQFNPNSEFWKQVPMTNYLDEIKGAISLNHTVDDAVVGIGYSRNFDQILDKTSVVHELNEYPTGGHNFTGVAFTQAMQKTVEFYNKYLKE